MYYENLIITGNFPIVGDSLNLIVSLKVNKLTEQDWLKENPLKVGDTFKYNDKLYEITIFQLSTSKLNLIHETRKT